MTAPKHFNQTVLGREDGIVYDDRQLSRDEAREAADLPAAQPVGLPVAPGDEGVRERVATALRQRGISPKLLADLLVTVIAFLVLAATGLDVNSDPVTIAALSKLAGFIAGVVVGPGKVVVDADELKPV